MNFFRTRLGSERGFSLVETLAALSVFSLVTVGLVPLLTSSLRGSSLARSYTIGKNVAVRSMERVRGLPFSRSVATTTTTRKVDVLDLYFPCAPGTAAQVLDPCGTTGTRYVFSGSYADPLRPAASDNIPAGTFITTCGSGSTNPACPRSLPAGYSVRFDAQFVRPSSSAGSETYSVLNSTTSPAVSTSYDWRSAASEIPPVQLVKLRISVYWMQGMDQELYELESLVADRKFGIEKIGGVAKVDYAVRALATYKDASGVPSSLVATFGQSESGITSRTSALAEQRTFAGSVTLTQEATGTTGALPLLSAPVEGASSAYSAPPDQTTLPDPAATAGPATATHVNLCQNPAVALSDCPQKKLVGFLAPSHTKEVSVSTANDLPNGSGMVLFHPTSTSTFDVLVDAQRSANATNPLNLLPNDLYNSAGTIDHPIFSVRPEPLVTSNSNCLPTSVSRACRSMFVRTSAVTGALSSSSTRRVETEGLVGMAQVRIFPVSFIPGSQGASKSVFEVTNFAARVFCKATGTGTSVQAAAEWSATIRYWREKATNDGKTDGEYVTDTWTQANFADKINQLKSVNPMVYEMPEAGTLLPVQQRGDVHLFPIPNSLAEFRRHGYFTDITGGLPTVTRDTQAGQTATAKLAGALTFTTASTDPSDAAFSHTSMNVVLGSLSCTAADRRT